MQAIEKLNQPITGKQLVYRVGAGKAIGFVIGILGFYMLPMFVTEPSLILRTAVLLWYPTIGAVVGVMGVFSWHPVLNFPLPWWVRGAMIGAWFNLLVTLFAYEQVSMMMAALAGEYMSFASPFWLVAEGAIIGMLIDFLLTRWFGEGLPER